MERAKVRIELSEGSPLPTQLRVKCREGDFWVEIRPWKGLPEKWSWVEVVKAKGGKLQEEGVGQSESEKGTVERISPQLPMEGPSTSSLHEEIRPEQVGRGGSTIITYIGEEEEDLEKLTDLRESKRIWEWVEGTLEEKFNEKFMGSPDSFSIWTLLGRKPSRKLCLWKRVGRVLAAEMRGLKIDTTGHSETRVAATQQISGQVVQMVDSSPTAREKNLASRQCEGASTDFLQQLRDTEDHGMEEDSGQQDYSPSAPLDEVEWARDTILDRAGSLGIKGLNKPEKFLQSWAERIEEEEKGRKPVPQLSC